MVQQAGVDEEGGEERSDPRKIAQQISTNERKTEEVVREVHNTIIKVMQIQ